MALEYDFTGKDNASLTFNKISQSVNVLQKNLISVDNSTKTFS